MSYYSRNRDWSDIGCFGWLLIFILVVALFFVEVWLACWLWGEIMVAIFGLPMLTKWQMFGLMILANLILPTAHVSRN